MVAATARRRLPRAERTRQVLDAAARAFARSGFAATSMDEIAAEAGVSKLMLYRDFEGKRELYEAILESVSRRLQEKVSDDPWRGASRRGEVALLQVAREQPEAFLLVFRHAAREPEFAAYAERFSAEAVASGEGRLAERIEDPVALRWTARMAFRVTVEAIIAWLEVGDPARDDAFLATLERVVSSTHQAAAIVAAAAGGAAGAPTPATSAGGDRAAAAGGEHASRAGGEPGAPG
jgi:AcrR family transcriptional regulator